MNKQINHIVYAHLLVAAIACGYFLLKTLPTEIMKQEDVPAQIVEVQTPLSPAAAAGKVLFQSKCASCHNIQVQLRAPALKDFEERGPWADRQKLYQWINNPEAFMKKDPYTRGLQKEYNMNMSGFPALTHEEIDQIAEYILSR